MKVINGSLLCDSKITARGVQGEAENNQEGKGGK